MGKKESPWRYFASGKSIYVGGKEAQRRWKVIIKTVLNDVGDILTLLEDDYTNVPAFQNTHMGRIYVCLLHLVEIDAMGNTIRTYAKGDTLDGGTLIGGKDMDKKEAMKRLEAIEAETAKLKEIINKPEGIVYDLTKIYGLTYRGSNTYTHLLLGVYDAYSWYSMSTTESTFNGKTYSTCKEALDDVSNINGARLFMFNNKKEALEYLMENK